MSTEQKIVDAVKELSEKGKRGEKPSIFDVLAIFMNHLDGEVKLVKLSSTRKVKNARKE